MKKEILFHCQTCFLLNKAFKKKYKFFVSILVHWVKYSSNKIITEKTIMTWTKKVNHVYF